MPDGYSERPFPLLRRAIVDMLDECPRHAVHGFCTVDITDTLKRLRALTPSFGGTPSLTAYVAWCYAHALGKRRELAGVRRGNRIIVFDDIDVGTVVERALPDGTPLPTRAWLRQANRKSFRELHDELRAIQDRPVRPHADQARFERFLRLPRPVRQALLRWRHRDPMVWKQTYGNAGLSSVTRFGDAPYLAWALPRAPQSVMLMMGSVALRPGVVGNRVEPRQFLALTLTVDHDLVDGGTGGRLLNDISDRLRCGTGLDEHDAPDESDDATP